MLSPASWRKSVRSQDVSDPGSDQAPDSVRILENMGEWFVIVVRGGKDYVTSFELEAYARSYAEGQRLGFGLEKCGEASEAD